MNAPLRKISPYIFHGQTTSLCPECYALVPAKIIFDDGNVYYQKRCKTHGISKALISTDIPFYKLAQDYIKPGDRPHVFQTRTEEGCPYDCGICPDHEPAQSVLPSGVKPRVLMLPQLPRTTVATSRRAAMHHNFTTSPPSAEASVRPSGDHARCTTPL